MNRITQEQQNDIFELMRECGELIRAAHNLEETDSAITVKPGAANFVTVYDVAVQQKLIAELTKLFPNAYFFAEEKENSFENTERGCCIFIDPIDGTTNFIHDMKCSAISVALYFDGKPLFGAVYDPYLKEMFHAAAGEGAFVNDRRITVSNRTLEKSLVAFGTAPYNRSSGVDERFARFMRVYMACADIRRTGSAALDVCYVACGRTDAYFEDTLSPWDYAAGALILSEAGGKITSYENEAIRPGVKSSVLCSNNALHAEMLSLIN